jgi:hypothetical protein
MAFYVKFCDFKYPLFVCTTVYRFEFYQTFYNVSDKPEVNNILIICVTTTAVALAVLIAILCFKVRKERVCSIFV